MISAASTLITSHKVRNGGKLWAAEIVLAVFVICKC